MLYPVIVGLDLRAREAELVRLWLSQRPEFIQRDEVLPGELSRGLNYFPNPGMDTLRELLDWRLPLLAIVSADRQTRPRRELFSLGLTALYPLPDLNGPLLFPALELPATRGRVFLVSDNELYRKVYRGLFRFAGFDLRADFHDAQEIITTLRATKPVAPPNRNQGVNHSETNSEKNRDYPELIIVDLDSKGVDSLRFFHHLTELYREAPALKEKTRCLVIGDFLNKPGKEVQDLGRRLRNHARRIFHPEEAVFIILEAYLSRPVEGPTTQGGIPAGDFRPLPQPAPLRPRNIHELLFGDNPTPGKRNPVREFNGRLSELEKMRRLLPFLWLGDVLQGASFSQGAALVSQPDINTSDLLHSVRSPDAPGEGTQHRGE